MESDLNEFMLGVVERSEMKYIPHKLLNECADKKNRQRSSRLINVVKRSIRVNQTIEADSIEVNDLLKKYEFNHHQSERRSSIR